MQNTAYVYKARDVTGKAIHGRMNAASREELADKLEKMGYVTTRVAEALPEIRAPVFQSFGRVGEEELIIFYHQMAHMLRAGISIVSALAVLERQTGGRKFRSVIGDISRSIEAGESLSAALAEHPRFFPKLFVSMVRSGEASGKLDRILESYARYAEDRLDLKQKIRSALFYPLILLVAGIGVSLFVVSHVIPQFAEIFLRAGVSLPAPTRCLYAVGIFIRRHGTWLAAAAAVLAIAAKAAAQTNAGGRVFDAMKLRIPVIGPLFRRTVVARFSKTLSILTASGVPVLESLEIASEVIGNRILASAVLAARAAVEKGERIGESLELSGEFPADAVHMIAAGEESGALDDMLEKTGGLYDMHVGYAVKRLTTVFEPLLLALMGCMVGAIMLSTLLPIFDMIRIIR